MISFIVPIVNRPDLLALFAQQFVSLGELHTAEQVPFFEVLVVDNGSNERTQRAVQAHLKMYPWFRSLRNEQNLGFGPANNIGVRHAKGDIFVFTQTDVEEISAYDLFLINQQVRDGALYGPRLVNWDSGWNFGIPYLEGWYLTCTRPTWEVLGGFDERYIPADYEDIDLSYTALHRGVVLRTISVPAKHNNPGATWSQFTGRDAITRTQRRRFMEKWNVAENFRYSKTG